MIVASVLLALSGFSLAFQVGWAVLVWSVSIHAVAAPAAPHRDQRDRAARAQLATVRCE